MRASRQLLDREGETELAARVAPPLEGLPRGQRAVRERPRHPGWLPGFLAGARATAKGAILLPLVPPCGIPVADQPRIGPARVVPETDAGHRDADPRADGIRARANREAPHAISRLGGEVRAGESREAPGIPPA